MNIRSAAVIIALLLPSTVLPRLASGQGQTVDEGTFLISRAGAPAGRESFRIVRSPSASGEVFRATAQISIGERRVVPALSTDSTGTPESYVVAVQDGAGPAIRLQARARPGRLSALLQTPHGESAREYIIPPTTVLLDDDIAHQLFFVTLSGRQPGSLTVVDPLSGRQTRATLERRGSESLSIGGQEVQATHYALASAELPRRDFWVDAVGRVLKVSCTAHQLTAVRDELPR